MTKLFAIRNSQTKEFFVQIPMDDRVIICDPSQVEDKFSRQNATPFVVTEKQLNDLWSMIEFGDIEFVTGFTYELKSIWVEVATRGSCELSEIIELSTGKRVHLDDDRSNDKDVTWEYYEPDSGNSFFDIKYDLENDPEFSMFAKLSGRGQTWGLKYNPFYPNENPHLRDEFLQEFKEKWGTPG